jgi:lipopolysaccharide/colanic/teichoic acid biosynthesis glycosyltransferase
LLETIPLSEVAGEAMCGNAFVIPASAGGTLAVGLSERHATYRRIVKPVGDRVLGTLLLLVMAPLFIAVAGLVSLTLGSGVLYRQRRVGKDNRAFTMYKFRTMAPDRRIRHEPHDGIDRRVRHKCDDDPRHTRCGRALRKWSLDELPQLWNVVVGDMSLIGPRPELAEVVMEHDLLDHPRNLVKPGITGLWQVSSARDELLYDNLEYDVAYVSDIGLWTDVKILAGTPGAVLARRGH